jgi:hypothetical protein
VSLLLEKQEAHDAVGTTVGSLTGVTFQDLAINVLPIRFVTRGEIIFDAYH